MPAAKGARMAPGADDPETLNPPAQATAKIQEAAFDSDLIDHMVRCWDAECENAERLARKVTTIISALALLFGLGLFKIEWTVDPKQVSRIPWDWMTWAIKAMLCVALLCFGRGLFLGIRGLRTKDFPREHAKTASDHLRLRRELIDAAPPTDKESRAVAFYCLSKAIDELSKQNAEKSTRVQLCETWFIRGLFLVLLAMLAYILFSFPPIPTRGVP